MATPVYSSAGTGFGTATSGVAWAPTCPATVNAGDILVAFISARDVVTNPVTPVGWTLLDGPRSDGTGRAWLFGRIADGTEDGATISFGTQAVSVNRSGQIYRFGGNDWTSQVITNIIAGFVTGTGTTTAVADAGVTTPYNNSLALQFLKIDDNNTVGNFAGETGGDWTEALAEYSNNASTGVTLQLQTAAMTTAGTINGGTLTQSAADPWVIIGCYIREPILTVSAGATLSGGGSLTATAAHIYIEGVALSGNGSLVVTGSKGLVDNRNGTALITGGGTIVATESKTSGFGSAVIHGGGSIVVTKVVSSGVSVVISGGGTPRIAYSTTGLIEGARVSGGGTLSANIIPASGSAVISGGGSVTVAGQSERVAVISGGGTIQATYSTTGILVGVVIHGGGTVKVNALEGAALIQGGGAIVATGSKNAYTPRISNHRAAGGLVYLFGHASAVLILSGGGAVTASGIAAKGIVVISGGGAPTATGTKDAVRNIVVTGGGQIIVTKTTSSASTATISGGGSLVTTYTRSTTINKDLVVQYDLRALASQDLLALYDLVEFGTAGANLLVSYGLRNLISQPLQVQYDLRVRINQDLAIQYDLLYTLPPVDIISEYDLRELVAEDLIAEYHVVVRLKKDFIAVYDVKPLIEDTSKAYAVLSRR